MSELRRAAADQRWVVVAPERDFRPSDFHPVEVESGGQALQSCPFCPGNEHMTPREVYRVASADGASWRVRVIPNKFPALGSGEPPADAPVGQLFDRMDGVGAHEVVVESPAHDQDIPDFSIDQMVHVVNTYIQRMRSLVDDPLFRMVQLFRNHGRDAGASLAHPHAQIIATPVIPQDVLRSLQIASSYRERNGSCVLCDLLLAEQQSGERMIDDLNGFAVWAPFDSRFPFEMVIVPEEHDHDFTSLREDQQRGLAATLIRTTQRLRSVLGNAPYNLLLKMAPPPMRRHDGEPCWSALARDYHWRIELLPRLTGVAGFEWATGMHINPVLPESAARRMREAKIE